MKKSLALFALSILVPVLLFASPIQSVKNTGDSVEVSLITCSPGSEIYSLFGHTAIRYRNTNKNIDVVFNYGMFNFNKPHFIFRFILGQTDYELGVEEYQDFQTNYSYENRSVEEQVLNLTEARNRSYTNFFSSIICPRIEHIAIISFMTIVLHALEIR